MNCIGIWPYFSHTKLFTTKKVNSVVFYIKVFSAWDQCTFHIQIIIIIRFPFSIEAINEVKTLVSLFKALCCIEYHFFDSVCLQDPIFDFILQRLIITITGIVVCDFITIWTKFLLLLQFEVFFIKGDKQTV